VGTVVSFPIGHAGAEKDGQSVRRDDIKPPTGGPVRHEVVARMLKHGEAMAPFLRKTAPPMKVPIGSREAMVAQPLNTQLLKQ